MGDDLSTSMAVYVGALYLLSFWRGCIFGLRLLEQSFEDGCAECEYNCSC